MELDDATFNQPPGFSEGKSRFIVDWTPSQWEYSVYRIRRLSTFIDILISSTDKSFNQAFSGISEVKEVFEKVAAFNGQLEIVKSALFDLDSEYKIQKLYERRPLFVKPETVSVGSRDEILPDSTI